MRLVFDLDGTLIDSAPDIHAVANEVAEVEGLDGFDLPTIRRFIGHGVPHLVGCMLTARGIKDAALARRMIEAFLSRYETAVDLTQPYPSVAATLQALSRAGHRLAVCTNKPLAPARAVLTHLGLLDCFDQVIGGDSGLPRKPDPATLREVLARMGEDAGPPAYIGDSEIDAATAESAGVPFLLFTEGYRKTPAAQLTQFARFSDFRELPALIDRLAEATEPYPSSPVR